MLPKLFENHGRFCAGHPLEVIVTTVTLTVCMLNLETGNAPTKESELPISTSTCWRSRCNSDDPSAADVILMTIIRCIAILFSYHQFRNLHNLGSKYIIGIAGSFTIFSGLVFTSGVVNFGRSNISDLKDAFFFFLLLIDVNKAGVMAQLALSSKNQEEVRANIARGMSLLGPSITLDTLVGVLLIGIGSLSGVKRLEVLCGFACLGVLVNYAVFMTFYPACLSLILELTRGHQGVRSLTADKILMMHSLDGEDQKPNPVVERVKMIMIAGLFVVHAHSRWPFKQEVEEETREDVTLVATSPSMPAFEPGHQNKTDDPLDFRNYLMNWLSVSADNIVILILLLALAVKVIFFEDKGEIAKQLRFKEDKQEVIFNRDDEETEQSAEPQVSTVRCTVTAAETSSSVFPLSGMGSDWFDESKVDKEVQTEKCESQNENLSESQERKEDENVVRDLEECKRIYNSELGAHALTDKEVIQLVKNRVIQAYQLEKAVGDLERGVGIRRLIVGDAGKFTQELVELPYQNYDYGKVLGSCCENVIGYVPVPLGVAGPLKVDGELVYVPMATTEGCLIASTNRGSRALMDSGVISRVVADGMTRGPVVRFPDIVHASEAMTWMQDPENFELMKESFDKTSRFARLQKIHVRIAGRYLFIRFVAFTGDAMGMNMLSKGTQESLRLVKEHFPDMEILSLSGNFCTDKKPAAVNWIEGRGKSVVCEAVVPAHVVSSVLKTSVHALIDVNIAKNMIGSAVAGSIGGFNAHAANIVTAIYIATGQDPAQNITSSNCMTLMEPWGPDGNDLYVSCTMPSIEIGTIGGGTGLPAQSACLGMLGVKGTSVDGPGMNASKLARIVCATVLAGELSLMAALTAGDLVRSHLRHNRSSTTVGNVTSSASRETGSSLTVPNVVHAIQAVCTKTYQGS